jgi:hypothetical protein
MDVGVVPQQSLLGGVVEVRAVVDAGLLAGCSTEDFGLPRIEMGVEVDDGDWTIGAVDAAEERQGDGVVASQGDDAGEGMSFLADAQGGGVRGGGTLQDAVVAFFDLLEGVGVVVAGSLISLLLETRRTGTRGRSRLTKSQEYLHNQSPSPTS